MRERARRRGETRAARRVALTQPSLHLSDENCTGLDECPRILPLCSRARNFAFEAMVASKQPRRSDLTSELSSVTSNSHVPKSGPVKKISDIDRLREDEVNSFLKDRGVHFAPDTNKYQRRCIAKAEFRFGITLVIGHCDYHLATK